ncbi:hypothetical protein DA83_02800 [Pseudomonas sp. 250J]|uniref:hypothetical protein n=1 Tax=unclassified Pseudomonas TaxID=196821 RepID=UPI00068178DC|nr:MULTISPECIES: hypothetical protein [unclassified Pseudomonas]KNX77269.1 hypothetical protein DA83_02800 [Pseudomonas sp. 250J]QZA52524.1 hypothetical protein K2O50_15980 [Pseudomonas sp. 2hn]
MTSIASPVNHTETSEGPNETQETIEVVCPRSSRLTPEDLALIGEVFPKHARIAFIEIKGMLNDQEAPYRRCGNGMMYIDWEGLKDAVRYRLGSRNVERLQALHDAMVCLGAIAKTPLSIPMRGGPIVLAR